MKCKISDWSCIYHACMSDDCQKKVVRDQEFNWGNGNCLKMKKMHKTRESIDAQQKATMRPIIFSTPMVQAILNGNKTMTRRIIKQQPRNTISSALKHPSVAIAKPGEYVVDNNRTIICRYGIPGDQLWVRETFFSSLP